MSSASPSTAFAPGHVTVFFSTYRADSPAATGSRGAGITLTDGVTATVTPIEKTDAGSESANVGIGKTDVGIEKANAETDSNTDIDDESKSDSDADGDPVTPRENQVSCEILLNGTPVFIESVSYVIEELGQPATVRLETPLPLGAGFGVSGAAALATALAANDQFDCRRTENELVRLAHEGDVTAETGLGDVVAQARGGVPIRLEPGAPGYGTLDGIAARRRVEYVSFGELSTTEILSSGTTPLSTVGEESLARLLENPTTETLLAEGRRFTREAGLATAAVAEAVDVVLENGGDASMAMLGRTVFAFDTGLSDVGYEPSVCEIHSGGATLHSGK